MATFDPQTAVDVSQPMYLRLSQPIDRFEGDTSAGVALKGAGELLSGAVHGTDTILKSAIEEKVYARVSAERDAYTNSLEQIRTGVTGLPPVGTSSTDVISGNTDKKDFPDGLNQYIDLAEKTNEARKIGKAPALYYATQLDKIAKDVRAEYPGYKMEIDELFKKISGKDPANERAAQLLSDINAAQSTKKDLFDKVGDALLKESNAGNITANVAFKQMQNTGDAQFGMDALTQMNADKYKAQTLRDRLQTKKDWEGYKKEDAQKDVEQILNDSLVTHFAVVKGPNGLTGQQVLDAMKNPGKYSDAQWDAIADSMAQSKVQWQAQMKAKFLERQGNGNSFAVNAGGQDEINKRINSIGSTFDDVIAGTKNKEFGLAFRASRQNQAIKDGAANGLLTDEKIGPSVQILTATNGLMPDWLKTISTDIIGKGLKPDLSEFLTRFQEKAATMKPQDFNGKGISPVPSEAIDRAKNSGVKDPVVYKSIVDFSNKLSDSRYDDDAKKNIISNFFSPRNLPMLSKIDADGVNQYGQKIAGKEAVFNNITSKSNIGEVARLTANDEQEKTNVIDWTEKSFSSQIFSNKIKDLSTYASMPFLKLQWVNDPKEDKMYWKVRVDDTGVPTSGGYASSPVNMDVVDQINKELAPINSGIAGLVNTYKAYGIDPEAKILKLLETSGYKPTDRSEGLPAKMMQSILSSRKPKKSDQELQQ